MTLNPDLAKQGGGGVEAGNYRVKSAKNQNVKTDYRPNQIYLVLALDQLDANFQPVREGEEQELRLSYGQESLKHYRVGVARDGNDQDPVAQSDEPDVEGNTIVPLDSEPFNKSCAAMVFLESLKKQGFPVETLNNGFAPDFAGMEFTLASYSPKECNDKFGTRLNTRPVQDRQDPTKTIEITYKVVTKWHNPNYLGSAASQGATTATASAPAGGSASTTTVSETPDELFTKVLKIVAERKKGGEIKSWQAFQGFVTNEYVKHNPKLPLSQLPAVQALSKDKEKVVEKLSELGIVPTYDDAGQATGVFQIPA